MHVDFHAHLILSCTIKENASMMTTPNSFGLAWNMLARWNQQCLAFSRRFALAEAIYLENVLGFKTVLAEVMESIKGMFGDQHLLSKTS